MMGSRTAPALVTTSTAAMARSLTVSVSRSKVTLDQGRRVDRLLARAEKECPSEAIAIDANAHPRPGMATEASPQSSADPNPCAFALLRNPMRESSIHGAA